MFLGLSFDFAHLLRRDAVVLAMSGSKLEELAPFFWLLLMQALSDSANAAEI